MDLRVQVDERLRTVPLSEAELEQILVSLALNAMQQISLHGIVHGRVEVVAKYHKDSPRKVHILVKDNGPGIHGRDLGRLFQFGFSTRQDGAGLGLFICRQLARARGGELSVKETVVFLGTTFCLELPD